MTILGLIALIPFIGVLLLHSLFLRVVKKGSM